MDKDYITYSADQLLNDDFSFSRNYTRLKKPGFLERSSDKKCRIIPRDRKCPSLPTHY